MIDLLGGLTEQLRLELLFKLVLAVLVGGLIGVERELQGKPAGLRTNILICVGATLFTSLSTALSGALGDPSRIAAQIVTGVGFIGAGTILHSRGGVVGLTSAATIWVVAAIGMALGAGLFIEAVGSAVLVAFVLSGLGWAEAFVARRQSHARLVIRTEPNDEVVGQIEGVIRRAGLEIMQRSVRREDADQVLELELRGPRRLHEQATIAVLHHAGVHTVSTGE